MRKLLTAIVTLAMVLLAFVVLTNSVRAQAPQGAYIDEAVFFEQPVAATALQQVSAGTEMQIYMFNLRNLADKQAALADPNIWTVQTPGSVNDLFINPVQFSNPQPGVSTYNIFVHQEIRRAMNWLVDRDFIIEQIYGGFGIPYISPWHSKMPEYAREAVFFQGLDKQYSYNPVLAKDTIFDALSGIPGMSFQADGKWYYQGLPLTVRFVIRIEDTRLDIGNYISDQIETLGITVNRDLKPGTAAFNCVYFGDPTGGCWSLYTEGFAFTALVAWQDDWIAGFYQQFSGETIWDFYTPPATLVDVSNRLLNSQYLDLAERQALIRQGSALATEDGVRVWLVAENAVFIFNKGLTGAVYDLMGGPWGLFTTRTARYAATGGSVKIGQPLHFNSQWNPVRGFTWLYDATQLRAFADSGITRHPHTGNPLGVRNQFTVETAGPSGTLDLPANAQTWDTATSAWVNVPAGAKAVSKVTCDCTFGKWHDGSEMSMDDKLVVISHFFRLQNGGAINPYTGAPYPTGDLGAIDLRGDSPGINFWMGLFKGLRVVDADTIEIWLDYWHVESDEIAAVASIWPTEPWTVWELMAKTVLDNEARYDAGSIAAGNCPGGCVLLDMGRGATIGLMNTDVTTLRTANQIPAGFSGIITTAEATTDWAAIDTFRQARGHFYVSNGPFYLDRIDAAAKQTTMKRFVDYPFAADKWDSILTPRVPQVTVGDVTTPGANPGEVVPGLPSTIQIRAAIGGQPYARVALDYLVTNPATGQLVTSGKPTATATAGTWEVSFSREQTSALLPGTYEIQVIGVGEEAAIPTTTTKTFVTIPQLVFFERLIGTVTAQLGTLQADLDQTQADLNAATAQLAALNSTLTTVLILAIVGIVIAVVAVAVAFMRRGKKVEMTMEPGPPAT